MSSSIFDLQGKKEKSNLQPHKIIHNMLKIDIHKTRKKKISETQIYATIITLYVNNYKLNLTNRTHRDQTYSNYYFMYSPKNVVIIYGSMLMISSLKMDC